MSFRDYVDMSHGLELSVDTTPNSRQNENGILFLVELFLILYIRKQLTLEEVSIFSQIVDNLAAYNSTGKQVKGVYDRGAKESLNPDKRDIRLISHDNLTAIASFSNKFDLSYAQDIAKHAFTLRFDNAQPDNQRFLYRDSDGKFHTSTQLHPRDIFFWLYIGGFSALTILLWPIFFITQFISCTTSLGTTSGKLLMFVRLESTYKKSWLLRFTRWVCYAKMRSMYGKYWLNEIMKIYYLDPKHPCRILSEGIEL